MQAQSSVDVDHVRELFLEYARSLGFSLCFQSFEEELASLPGKYATPGGRLLLAQSSQEVAGCVALRKIESSICEMKRLYVRPEFRGQGVGRALVERVIDEAREAGYGRMHLDTVEPMMKDAVAMYRRFGFNEIPPYCANPMPGALYMELEI